MADDPLALEWVVRNKELQRKRISVAQALEKSGRFHQKLILLDLWVESLTCLVRKHGQEDLRDELAWALSSRALTYLSLSRTERALQDIERAVAIFEQLVLNESKNQFRTGLGAAYNRRSELLFAKGDFELAIQDSSKAVELYGLLVDDLGKDELRPLQALSRLNLAIIWNAMGEFKESLTEAQSAVKVYNAMVGTPEGKPHQSDHAKARRLLAQVRLELGQNEEACADASKSVQILNELIDVEHKLDVKDQLAEAYLLRAKSYCRCQQLDLASKDYSKSIQLLNQLLDEGRLDLRDEIAESYTQRSQLSLLQNEPKEALRDLTKAIEFLNKLQEEGRLDQLVPLSKALTQRAHLYSLSDQLDLASSDFAKAIKALEGLADKDSARRELAGVYLQKAKGSLEQSRYLDCIGDAQQAIGLSEKAHSNWSPQERKLVEAAAKFLSGEANRRNLLLAPAREQLEAACGIYYDFVHQHQRIDLLQDLASCYCSLSEVSLMQKRPDTSLQESKRAFEACLVLLEKEPSNTLKGMVGRCLSSRGEAHLQLEMATAAVDDLKRGREYFEAIPEAAMLPSLAGELGILCRRLSSALNDCGFVDKAAEAIEASNQKFQHLWVQDRKGPWLDEICRTSRVRSSISISLKDTAAAEDEIGRAFEHFSGLVQKGQLSYVEDLAACYQQRALNYSRANNAARSEEELAKLADWTGQLVQSHPELDLRPIQARALLDRARIQVGHRDYNNAYNTFEEAANLFRSLVVEEGRSELGPSFASAYMERGQMLLSAGHAANAGQDLTQAAQILTILVNQGRQELSRKLSQVALSRATAFISQQQYPAALEDLNVSIEILLTLASTESSPDFLAELAKALQQRAKLYAIGQAVPQASEDYSKAIQLYRTLVEGHNRSEFSSDLAECLMSNLALSGDPTEPANQSMLVQAIQLVIGKTREGKNPPEGFVVDSLRTLLKAVGNDPSSIRSDLAEVVLKLVEHAAQMPKGHLDWVQATEIMQQISELLNPRTEPRYLHLIILCCLTTNKEVSVHGEASLLRVIFYLRRLAEVIEMHSRTPDCVGGVGQAFNVIIEYGKFFNQEQNRAQAADMVNLWRKLQPSLPAAANIPRQLLASLARSL